VSCLENTPPVAAGKVEVDIPVVAEVFGVDVAEVVDVVVVVAVLVDVEDAGSIVGPSVAPPDKVVPGGGHTSPTGQHPPPCTHVWL